MVVSVLVQYSKKANPACWASSGAVLSSARPDPPVQQPNVSSAGRKAVVNGNSAAYVDSNADWSLSYPTSIDVSADDETYVTVYSVDLREP